MIKRYLEKQIIQDLQEKMVFIAGPRQVGKTTLAKHLGKEYFPSFTYLNWDYRPDRKAIINYQFPGGTDLLIFDELHKYKDWKNYIKGIFDKYGREIKILLTGSAKLDVYRQGGDSLSGRYHYYILHPLSLSEALGIKPKNRTFSKLEFIENKKTKEYFERLWTFGNFPEPFIKKNKRHWQRWQNERIDSLIKEEIRDFQAIKTLSGMQVLVELLPDKVGSLLSINNLSEDLQVNFRTAANWLEILERLYFHFRIHPFAKKRIRSLRKATKLYLWDWTMIANKAARLENLVGSHLLKFTHYLRNYKGEKAELYYLQDTEGRETDFLITVNQEPWFSVEVKLTMAETLIQQYFADRLGIPYLYQVVLEPNIDFFKDRIRVISVNKFLTALV